MDELEDPLIALGLVDNRQQVQSIVRMVDDDGSEMIEFPEFLSIIKGGSNAVSSTFVTRLIHRRRAAGTTAPGPSTNSSRT